MKTISKIMALACALMLCVACGGPKVTGDPEKDAATYAKLLESDPEAAEVYMEELSETYDEADMWDFIEACSEIVLGNEDYYDEVFEAAEAQVEEWFGDYTEEDLENLASEVEGTLESVGEKFEEGLDELASEVESALESLFDL